MVEGLVVRNYENKDLEEILKIHCNTFLPINGEKEYQKSLERFKTQLKSSLVIVAEYEERVVGLGAYILLKEYPDIVEKVKLSLNLAQNYEEKYLHYTQMRTRQSIGKGRIVVDLFENQFTQPDFELNENDFYFTDLTIHANYRKMGIGSELILHRIKIVKELGARAIFVDCWGGDKVHQLYEKNGFLPIIRLGPTYNDGNASTTMGLLL
jgi:GNAT superfamily N-acetyltransferase